MELKLNAVFILLILSLTLVSCAPPATTVDYFPNGYIITEAQQSAVKLNENFTYNFLLYNASTGKSIPNETGLSCRIFITDNTGSLLLAKNASFVLNEYWSVNISSDIFNHTGEFPYGVDCINSYGGAIAGTFFVTPTGTLLEVSDSVLYFVFLAILFVIMLGLFKILFSSENKYLKYGLVAIIYILSNVFLLILWKVSEYFLYLVPFIQTLFNALYVISTIGYFILFPVLIFSMIMSIFDDKEVLKLQESGYSDEDISRVRRRR